MACWITLSNQEPTPWQVLSIVIPGWLFLIVTKSHLTLWRFAGHRDYALLGIAGTITGITALLRGFHAESAIFIVALTAGALASLRLAWHFSQRMPLLHRDRQQFVQRKSLPPHRVLIIGAGAAGYLVNRDLKLSNPLNISVVGFLDDSTEKQGMLLNGDEILGRVDELATIVRKKKVDEVVIAVPSAGPSVISNWLADCERIGVRARAIPSAVTIVQGTYVHRPGIATMTLLEPSVVLRNESAITDNGVVLVTGGAGYVGSHLVKRLMDAGHRVRVLDRFFYGTRGLTHLKNDPRLEIIEGDIASIRDVGTALRGAEYCIALAALVGDPACALRPDETVFQNYEATKTLVEQCDYYGVKRLVFASSCSVYGATDSEEILLKEKSLLNPVSLYARTRILSEEIIMDRARAVEPVVLRLSTVFGLSPRMRFDLVVNTMTMNAIANGVISVSGGDQWRPNIHCRDAALAFHTAMIADSSKVSRQVFNVGHETLNHTIAEIAGIVAEVTGAEIKTNHNVSDKRNYRVDFSKIRETLNFTPDFSIRDGVSEIANALRKGDFGGDLMNPIYSNVRTLEQLHVGA